MGRGEDADTGAGLCVSTQRNPSDRRHERPCFDRPAARTLAAPHGRLGGRRCDTRPMRQDAFAVLCSIFVISSFRRNFSSFMRAIS